MTHFYMIKDNGRDTYLEKEATNYLGFETVNTIKTYDIYESTEDISILEGKLYDTVKVDSLSDFDKEANFRYRANLGQYDDKEVAINQLANNHYQITTPIHHSVIVETDGLNEKEVNTLKDYLLNDIEYEEVNFDDLSYEVKSSDWDDLNKVEGFIKLDEKGLEDFSKDYSMGVDDLLVVQNHFKSLDTNPTVFQLKVIDTYWSDHCRHTTFNTELVDIIVRDGVYKNVIARALDDYYETHNEEFVGRERDITLMDMATINSRQAKRLGYVDDVEESDEVNAITIKIKVDVDGVEEDYLLSFKNETHNHPTEIEPFGGAATCVGGGVRDPLSGRAYVYQVMRISGAGDPTEAFDQTREGKLPQRVLSQRSADGNSSYSNGIGLTAGYAREYYDPGFKAKHMELGALVGAAPASYVVREDPIPGDAIILLGGETGRDGLGAAVGSSKVQTKDSLALQGAEVQKGNPQLERKIVRLFRNPEATRLIKKSNDFGAGGVSVAIGELADGLTIYLDRVPVKYPGLNPAEIALSESQERMAVVIAAENVEKFETLALQEDLNAVTVAHVTDNDEMVMYYDDEEVMRLSRSFLDQNGAHKTASAEIVAQDINQAFDENRPLNEQLKDIKNANQKAMGQQFNATIGKGSVLLPYGGIYQATPQQAMASTVPVENGTTTSASVMSSAYFPEVAKLSPFHGAYYAVISSIAKAVALGVPYQKARLTLQEYFESLGDDPEKWGKPTASLLGAFKAMKQFNLGALGGKDSMSGTYQDITVPPTLISFAVGMTDVDSITSREFKQIDSQIVLLQANLNDEDTFEAKEMQAIFEEIHGLTQSEELLSISVLDDKTLGVNIAEMTFGNRIGAKIDQYDANYQHPLAFVIEVSGNYEGNGEVIGRTIGESQVVFENENYSLKELYTNYDDQLTDVFHGTELKPVPASEENETAIDDTQTSFAVNETSKVIIPVLTGTTGEYDMHSTLSKYTDHIDFFVIKENEDYAQSIGEFKEALKDYDVLALADGQLAADAVEYGVGMQAFLEELGDDLNAFVKENYVLGIGSAFAGLVRSGLIEFGEIKAGTSIHFTENPENQFINAVTTGRFVAVNALNQLGDYLTAVNGNNITLKTDLNEQVVSVFNETFDGEPAVDAMVDPSGHILGSVSNIEQVPHSGFLNLTLQTDKAFFK